MIIVHRGSGSGGLAIGGTVTGGTAGLIPYIAAGPVLAQSPNLAFDGTTLTISGANVQLVRVAGTGGNYVDINPVGYLLAASGSFQFYGATTGSYAEVLAKRFSLQGDVLVERDGPNTLAQRNGTAAQISRLYKTYTDVNNGEWLEFGYNSGVGGWNIFGNYNGTGTATPRDLYLGGNNVDWLFQVGGMFGPRLDNANDFGASGANRPRTGYFGTSVVVGSPAGGTSYSQTRLHVKSVSATPWSIISEASANDDVAAFGHTGSAATFASSYLSSGGYTPMEFQTSSLTRMQIAVDGKVGVGITSSLAAQLHVVAGSASTVGIIVDAVASQSAPVQKWRNVNGTDIAKIDFGGGSGLGVRPIFQLFSNSSNGTVTMGVDEGGRAFFQQQHSLGLAASLDIFGVGPWYNGNYADDFVKFGAANARWQEGHIIWLRSQGGRKRLTADVTNATATLANLSDLSQTLIAGRKYFGVLSIVASNSQAAEGIQIDFGGGSLTATSFQANLVGAPGATLGVVDATTLTTALTATTATTGNIVYVIHFEIVVNAGGTFIPRIAEVSHTSGTVTAKLGSYLLTEDSTN